MHICVIGTGSVGLVTAAGLADAGHKVTAVDRNLRKIKLLRESRSPIYEPGVEDVLRRNIDSGNLEFTSRIEEAIGGSHVIFIAVGTPEGFDGQPNMNYVTEAVHSIAENINSDKVIVIKSTVPVGTGRRIENYLKTRCPGMGIHVVSNPDFLREGNAMEDFLHPDRIVIGLNSDEPRKAILEVYRDFNRIRVPFFWCSPETAELSKYANNSFLALKITLINQLASLAAETGAEISDIAAVLGLDRRIGPDYFRAGPGYGGSCFPRDTRALVKTGEQFGVDMSLIRELIDSNERNKKNVVSRLEAIAGSLEESSVAVLGLSFKAGTDDVRESPAITIVNDLIFRGADVKAYDPRAMENFREHFPYISYSDSAEEAVKEADILIIATEWKEFGNLDPRKLKKLMKGDLLYDTRNLLDREAFTEAGFRYLGTGRKLTLPADDRETAEVYRKGK